MFRTSIKFYLPFPKTVFSSWFRLKRKKICPTVFDCFFFHFSISCNKNVVAHTRCFGFRLSFIVNFVGQLFVLIHIHPNAATVCLLAINQSNVSAYFLPTKKSQEHCSYRHVREKRQLITDVRESATPRPCDARRAGAVRRAHHRKPVHWALNLGVRPSVWAHFWLHFNMYCFTDATYG